MRRSLAVALLAFLACGKGGGSPASSTPARANSAPNANINVTPSGAAIVGATSVSSSAVASDPDGDPLTYVWNFGDGSSAQGQAASHVFGSMGTFAVTVTVTDGRGGSTTASTNIRVGTVAGSWHSDARGYYFDLEQSGTRITGRLVGYTPGPVYYRNPFPLTGTVTATSQVSFALNADGGFNFEGMPDASLNAITGTLRDSRSYGDVLRRLN
jgi:hypothetical protein